MQIVLAEAFGMCFGVRDALATMNEIDDPAQVAVHGELVHNEQVLHQLEIKGFRQVSEQDRQTLPSTDRVLITAHGISDRERARLQLAGKTLIDTTCPLVSRAHDAALKLRDAGCHVIVIGRRGHVEVQGLIEDLTHYDIVQDLADVRNWSAPQLGVICQTTTPATQAAELREAITRANPHATIRFVDTICHPTKDRQRALERLLDLADVMVVVGGRHSNNTRQLCEASRIRSIPAYQVQTETDLDPGWFTPAMTVGLTAGTSTLDETVEAVRQRLLQLFPISA